MPSHTSARRRNDGTAAGRWGNESGGGGLPSHSSVGGALLSEGPLGGVALFWRALRIEGGLALPAETILTLLRVCGRPVGECKVLRHGCCRIVRRRLLDDQRLAGQWRPWSSISFRRSRTSRVRAVWRRRGCRGRRCGLSGRSGWEGLFLFFRLGCDAGEQEALDPAQGHAEVLR